MKHLFYVLYVFIYTGAVFVCGMFVGQFIERSWARREQEARAKAVAKHPDEIGIGAHDANAAMTAKGE